MARQLISTREVAAILHVTETTVRRWADEHVLPCTRTFGGHRKFLLKDVAAFAEHQGIAVPGSQPPPMNRKQEEQLQAGVVTQQFEKVATILKKNALEANRQGLEGLLLYLYRQHIPLMVILDDVIRPAFEQIGHGWEYGSLEVNQEHRASNALTEALARTVEDIHRKPANGRSAVCACLDGELHEIGLRGLAYTLECEGWSVHYLGANTPADTMTSFIRAHRPDLTCISVTIARPRGDLVTAIRTIARRAHAQGGKVVVGGSTGSTFNAREVKSDLVAGSVHDAIAYVRDVFQLKPGPKSRRNHA